MKLTWKFEDFAVYTNYAGKENVVAGLTYTLYAMQEIVRIEDPNNLPTITDGAEPEFATASHIDHVRFDLTDFDKDFVPFEQLTPEIVEEWVKKSIDYKALSAHLIQRVLSSWEELKTNVPPPWE
jgi:hypothetical protein